MRHNIWLPLAVLAATLCTATTFGGEATEGYLPAEDGVRLYYRSVGHGSETVVIPVAVFTSPHFDALAQDRRVVYYDPRGRGRSDLGDLSRVSAERASRDLEQLRLQLGLERMALVGFSGYGLEVALYALAHPERVTRFVQLAPVPPRREPWMEQAMAARRARADAAAWQEFDRLRESKDADQQALCLQEQKATLPASLANPANLAKLDLAAICTWPNEWSENQGRFFEILLPTLPADVRGRIGELRMPRLVIHAERDVFPLEGTREWLPASSNARLLRVPDAGHLAYIDRPEVVVPAIESFLRGEWPPGAEPAGEPSAALRAQKEPRLDP